MPVIKSYALAKVRYIGKSPLNKETGKPKPHVKDGISFEPSEDPNLDWIKDVPYEKATAMVRRWPDIYEFVHEDDATAKTAIDKLMEANERLQARLEALETKSPETAPEPEPEEAVEKTAEPKSKPKRKYKKAPQKDK